MKKYSTSKTFASILSRREMFGFVGGTAAFLLVGNWRKQAVSLTQAIATPSCVAKPEQTEGPYFVDEKLNRFDIRSDPSDGSVERGVPLQLVFQVSQLGNSSCTPLKNATVDVWHCNAKGIYSDASDRSFNTVGKKFLRGYQVTDEQGVAKFITIYPGWYPGRAVHIHFKISTNSKSQPSYEFTSQLYFNDSLSDRIYTQSIYSKPGQRLLNKRDKIFQNGGKQLTLQLTPAAEGYIGKFAIGLELPS